MSTLFKLLNLSQPFDNDGIYGVVPMGCSTIHTRATPEQRSTPFCSAVSLNTENHHSVCRQLVHLPVMSSASS